ncbi:cytochrome c maturation protein CcmE [Candidatus Mesenet endosymbiont of Phosphuga atrata]|uniref:cytochrome c maturation protein CcmE n=1 Tax=Candidatus Mesenet endosymbiont of Phosphuga atrata TaxID=3066221 RepID=UPI0030D2AB6C
MKKKHKRLLLITIIFFILNFAFFFILSKLKENISFFYTVSEAISLPTDDKVIRIGGMVVEGSIDKDKNNRFFFKMTDFNNEIKIEYNGIPPAMFTESNGVIVKGRIIHNNVFIADELFAKHDEKYMPKKYKFS